MTLAHFTVWYKIISGGEDVKTEVTSGRLPRCKMAWVQLLKGAIKLA